jgi:hypothetical protein
MELENIINNKDYKIIFLKAILLGINYGESNNVNYYKEALQKELLKINKKNLDIQNELNSEKEIENNIFIQKYKNILISLEKQKLYTINLIQTLSNTHYGYNYSKINLLKNNLMLIIKEIEKNKIILKNKEKTIVDIPKKNIFGEIIDNKNNANSVLENINKINQKSNLQEYNNLKNRILPKFNGSEQNITLKPRYYSEVGVSKENIINNKNLQKLNNINYFTRNFENNKIIPEYIPNDISDSEIHKNNLEENSKKENLVGELEKTLDNLSSLIIS